MPLSVSKTSKWWYSSRRANIILFLRHIFKTVYEEFVFNSNKFTPRSFTQDLMEFSIRIPSGNLCVCFTFTTRTVCTFWITIPLFFKQLIIYLTRYYMSSMHANRHTDRQTNERIHVRKQTKNATLKSWNKLLPSSSSSSSNELKTNFEW